MQKPGLNDEPAHRITYEGPLVRPGSAERVEATQGEAQLLKNPIRHQSSINSKNMYGVDRSNQSEKELRSNRQPFQKSQNGSIKNLKNQSFCNEDLP